VGLARRRLVNLEQIAEGLDPPEAILRAQQVADRAVTLLGNDRKLVPLTSPASACFLVLAENCCSTAGATFSQEVRKRAPKAQITVLNPQMPDVQLDQIAAQASACPLVVAAAFVSTAAYPKLLNSVIAAGRPVVLIALGNPYLLRSFPGVSACLATYSTVPPSEIAAVKALFGEIPIQGRLPVTIPGFANYGDGLQAPAPVGWASTPAVGF
jgi:beta-N-acetylhexosaminidase